MLISNPRNWFKREPASPAFGKDKIVPQSEASFLSRLTFEWLAPFLYVGASRPLEKDDLWSLPPNRRTDALTNLVESHFYVRVPPDKQPAHFQDIAGPSAKEKNVGDYASTGERDIEKAANDGGITPSDSLSEAKVKKQAKPKLSFFRHKPAQEQTKNTSAEGPTKYPKHPLLSAIHAAFFWRWWTAGLLKLFSDTLKTTTPLVTKLLLAWLTEAFIFAKSGGLTQRPRNVGYGIGLGIAIFVMQESASLMNNHYTMTTMTNGLLIRSALIGAIFRKSLRLSGRARAKHSVGQITTMISTDATRLDLSAATFHNLWTSPIQIIIGVALLINNLGYSALVGLGVLIIGFPIQFALVRVMFRSRRSGVQITDRRVRLTSEVLQGIRLIKLYAWEAFYAHQIGGLREKEIVKIRRIAIARAALISVVTAIPILAAVLSFITYALSGHDLNPAIIFSSLQFFNIIRAPMFFFPMVLGNVSDALVALGRIGTFLLAEELEEPYTINDAPSNKCAIRADGSFAWETAGKVDADKFGRKGTGARGGGKDKPKKSSDSGQGKNSNSTTNGRRWWSRGKLENTPQVLPAPATAGTSDTRAQFDEENAGANNNVVTQEKEKEKPFELTDLKLHIPKGQFVAIVGRVGSGKSSLLQSLIGEMRKVNGEVVFGGSVAYVPQTAWIMNATLRENVLFGREEDEIKFQKIIQACSLQHDIDMLPNGVDTEIGEKGINLSGGQKARVSLARAAYSDSDIILLDDPLSAVDAHVGKAILDDCLLNGPLANKTRVLVTHALHVLAKTDYIYTMEGGKITEEGTYQSLMKDGKEFARLLEEFGANEETELVDTDEDVDVKGDSSIKPIQSPDEKKPQQQLMTEEERNIGAVPLTVYKKYLKYAGGIIWAPTIILLLALTQGASVGNNLFLGFWTASSIPNFSEGDYMGVYAALGIAQAIFSFITSFTFSLVGLYASLRLFKAALMGVLRSPVSFFDTTPMGRIISRLSKDQDTLDTQLSMTLFMLMLTFSNVFGTVALVFYTFPYLGIIFAPLSVLYYLVSSFYRKSSVETKRLDSLMRSALYASYSETLTGLSTVRAYREQERFVESAEHGLDLENRAYYMTVSIQRWLSVRLDLFGNILILGIALFAAGFRNTVNPSKIGVVLSYSLSSTQVFSDGVSQFAQNEQNMNAVERVLVYTDLPREGTATKPGHVAPSWPEKGEVKFKNVGLAYREGLPLVLKDVSFEVKPGEKVGIVGRTGAGKSSLLQALFRMVELSDGAIEIDNVIIQSVDLDTLRQSLALVPQDSTLFLGTLRDNLDPQNTRTDAEIISALRRAWLIPPEGTPMDAAAERKFSLDAAVSDEGSNYSAGEKQLLALSRALLKNSRIIVLDEATSSVDVETDAKLQRTIQTEFSTCTLLCIAHRLKTIVYYDRVLVMEGGMVAEFDTPLALFDRENSIFRSLCDEAGLTRQDIIKIREGADIDRS
ncbi:multidrug resistance-associated ABC transporter [Fomitiporia mediterranea MF3/22]|uniref:multidrug resistance-associated ABC transporter n=1 Tax=Fomitiporia mediterranea (strain MF3/22) TaxID=694068 RepID=UPI0004409486|nr:multidrug resistance-associated ABC transporter [Fomitiporia mediterranea MF3/22]EJD02283.1 multidrug resistance-associated ABC transporter [Fomitiporia mediterranea MF3/22]